MKTIDAAKGYANQGVPVFPCKPARFGSEMKRPFGDCCPHGYKDATTKIERIITWWRKHPDALIGIPTGEPSGITVIDADIKGGYDGIKEIEKLTSQYGALPETTIVQTAHKGRHWWFKYEPGLTVSAGQIGRNIDLRGDGGYVIAPPSPNYTFLKQVKELASMPKWLVERAMKKKKVVDIRGGAFNRRQRIPETQRNAYLTQQAGAMHQAGIQPEAILAALGAMREYECEEGEEPIRDKELYSLAFRNEWLRDPDFEFEENINDIPPTVRASTILSKRYNPLIYTVAEIMPEGAMLAHGLPKVGKSYLALHFAICVSEGLKVLDKYDVLQGSVLYIALDDKSQRRLKRRMKSLNVKKGMGKKLEFWFDMPCIGQGFEERIVAWVKEHSDARLIIIDTFGDIIPEQPNNKTQYLFEKKVAAEIEGIAEKFQITILVLHHSTKSKERGINYHGSTGVYGGLSGKMEIRAFELESMNATQQRTIEEDAITLSIEHRDLDTHSTLACTIMPEFRFLDQLAGHFKGPAEKRIYEAVGGLQYGLTAKEIAEKSNTNLNTIRQQLKRMKQDDRIKATRIKGVYRYHF